jgi:tetratricopeptide (TPR) repeat protein
MAQGEFALVRQHLEAGLAVAGELAGEHDIYAMLADVAALERDADALRRYTPQAEEMSARYGHVLYQAIASRARGVAHRLAGEYPEAEARLKQALELFRGLEARWQVGRTWFELAELAQIRVDADGARDYYSLALAAFEEMRAAPDAACARAALKTLG